MAMKFKTHETPEGNTQDVVIRVSKIDNGFVIKAGGPPHHVAGIQELRTEVGDLLEVFAREVMIARPVPAPTKKSGTK